MKAIQYTTIGAEPELTEIPKPEPGPGEVLLEVTAAQPTRRQRPAIEDHFTPGTSLEQILDLHEFDRKLALLILDATRSRHATPRRKCDSRHSWIVPYA